ncbi:MAG: ATP-binding protein [Gammaproteobacteria bacterium]
MYREAERDLLAWRDQPEFKPLLVRGARQTGKSYLVEKFGEKYFDHFVVVNFEFNRKFRACFEDLDPVKIISMLSRMTNKEIVPGKTLLFLDEIQECPEAILALRYFKEKMPNLHVIAAGSLLEFVLNKPDFRMPVGRIQSYYLTPCTFNEYLMASGYDKLCESLSEVSLETGLEAGLHDLLLERVKEYFVLGGMPEVISHFTRHHDLRQCHAIQASLLEFYRKDFGKYGLHTKVNYLETLFDKIPRFIAQKFKYASAMPEVLSRDLKPVLQALIDAGLVSPVHHTSASGLPLHSTINERIFKLFFVDIGLVSHMNELDLYEVIAEPLMSLNRGALAEQYVYQELISSQRSYEKAQLFYWQRDKRGSTAEVDFVINVGSKIFPVEVKSGKTGRLKSLRVFLEEKKATLGLRVSEQPLSYQQGILSVPFYLIREIPRLVQEVLSVAD